MKYVGVGHNVNVEIPIMPHEDEESVDCCGCLIVRAEGGDIELYCNECGAVVVRGRDHVEPYVRRFLGNPATVPMDVCRHCGALNTFPELSTVVAYVCERCGEAMDLAE